MIVDDLPEYMVALKILLNIVEKDCFLYNPYPIAILRKHTIINT